MSPTGLLKVASLGLIAINLSACSSSSWLKDIIVTTETQNADQVIQVAATLQTASMTLAGLSVPIYANNGAAIGSVALVTPASGSGTEVALDIDLTTALGLSDAGADISHDATLPNGTAIPISNVDPSKLMTFNVGSAGSKAYVLYDSTTNQALVGLALVVNGISSGVTANLLLPYTIGALSGSVGPFSGAAASQSGIALFVNASSVVAPAASAASNPSTVLKAKVAAIAAPVSAKSIVFKVSTSAKSSDQKKIENHLADLNSKRAKLQAQ